jgi:hypothetical protein
VLTGAPSSAKVRSFRAVRTGCGVATFRLTGLDPATIRSARLHAYGTQRRVPRRRIRSATRRGTLRLRLPRGQSRRDDGRLCKLLRARRLALRYAAEARRGGGTFKGHSRRHWLDRARRLLAKIETRRAQLPAQRRRGRKPRLSVTTGAARLRRPDPVIAAAGDISDNSLSGQDRTDELVVNQGLDAVLTLGDNQYDNGTLSDFNAYFKPTWGRAKSIMFPSPGNHDTCPDSGYDEYFGGRAPGCWYGFDIGDWRFISLDSNQPSNPDQLSFLDRELATQSSKCVAAYWHHPRFSSSSRHGNQREVDVFWTRLYSAGADLVLSAHDHVYERFAPQSPSGQRDDTRGIREFIVGTGGKGLYDFAGVQPNSEVRNKDTHGVLRLTLHSTSYDWQFVPVAGGTFSDSGTGACH